MSDHTTGTAERTNQQREAMDERTPVVATVRDQPTMNLAAVAIGVLSLFRAGQTASRSKPRAIALGIVGVALVAVGVRERRTDDGPSGGDINPRGTVDEPDVETKTDPDEGQIQFTDDQTAEPRHKPDLDDAPEDPRRDTPDNGDEEVEVDLSEATLADEASEATGPSTEQAYPAKEGTDPEPTGEGAIEGTGGNPTPDKDTSELQGASEPTDDERSDASGDSGTETGDDEVRTSGGETVRTDTNQSGTMETDVEDVTDDEDLTETMLERDADDEDGDDES